MPACLTLDQYDSTYFGSSTEKYDSTVLSHLSVEDMQFLHSKNLLLPLYLGLSQQQQLLSAGVASKSPLTPTFTSSCASSPFDLIPNEILDYILELVHADTSRPIYDVLRDISSLCLVSKQFNLVATTWLYRHVPISDPYAFTKFLAQISHHPDKGALVKTLDFSPFSTVSLGRSANDNKQIKMVCSETLVECLKLVPNLQELLLTEALDPDLESEVVENIFSSETLPKLEAVDFCGSTGDSFVYAFQEMIQSHFDLTTHQLIRPFPPIQRLSLHGCQTIPADVYPLLLSALPNLTHLDLSSTQVNSQGLLSINPRSCLRHLYLGNCGNISGKALLAFVLHHPSSALLESLNIRMSDELVHPVSPPDIPIFLQALKSKATLHMLDISGMPVVDEHAIDFPTTLTELGVHRSNLTSSGIEVLLRKLPQLFYLNLEAYQSGGRLRLSQYADVFSSIRKHHPNVRVVECSGSGIESTDEMYDILMGWHWLHGRSRRGWLVNKSEYEDLRKANRGYVKVGWKSNKLNCCRSRQDLHGHYWYYAYGR